MGVTGTNKLAELAAELREQVPPQFLPKQDATLRADFAVAEAPAHDDTPEADMQDFSLEIAETASGALTQQPVISAADEDAKSELELEAEPEPSEHLFNVVDTPGAADLFEDEEGVAAVHEEEEENLRRRNFQAQDAAADGKDFESSVNGYQALGPWVNARADESAEKKRQKEDEKFTQSILKKMLEDRIKWLDEQIAFWKEKVRYWEEASDVIADAIARKNRGEEIEVDENGLPRDRRLREYLDDYEKKYGRRLDINNKDDLLRLQQFARDEKDYAAQNLEQKERERRQAQEQLRELESGGMTPEKEQRLERQLGSLEGQKAVGEIAALSNSRELNQTIDAIAATSANDRSLVESRLAGQSGYVQADASAEDALFGGGTSAAKNIDPVEGLPQSITSGFRVAVNAEREPATEDPAQRVAAAPASVPVRSA